MPRQTFHFLNVRDGDCSIIEHSSGNVSVVDVCNARKPENRTGLSEWEEFSLLVDSQTIAKSSGARKNYGQKKHPVNPIEYMRGHGIRSVFRLAISHPDMDHMDGLVDFMEEFRPLNFWDTNNNKEMKDEWGARFRKEDWLLYKEIRDTSPAVDPKRLTLYSGDDDAHRTRDSNGQPPGDRFYTLAPTPELVRAANESGDYNDASYVFLYDSPGGKIVMSGDSHDATWEHILENHAEQVSDVDILVAPHHGRKSGRDFKFLDVLRPRLTFFGNAASKDLSYDAWQSRELKYITNNQAGCMVVDCGASPLQVYVTNEEFAKDRNPTTTYSSLYKAWLLTDV